MRAWADAFGRGANPFTKKMLYSIIYTLSIFSDGLHVCGVRPSEFCRQRYVIERIVAASFDCTGGAGGALGRIFLGGGMSIIVENLTVSYQQRPAVHHVSAEFEAGKMWAVFGPNGAGKSTLLKAVMGLQKAETGSVHWLGMKRKDIAYLPQQSEIDRSQPMTVFELAAMGLWYEIGFFGRVNAEQRRRVYEALKRVEMQDFADRQIAHLSNGQFQRVLFARMLAQNAKFLLLDEPFNAVDARTTYALLDVLRRCHEEGQAVIAVLHDYEQVRAYFAHTLLLAREKIAAGATEEVLTDGFLAQANAAMQKEDFADWCEV